MKSLSLPALLLLAACAHDLALMKRDETLNAYRAAIRWAAFDAAAKYQTPRAQQLTTPKGLREVRVSGYDVITQNSDKERMTLSQTVAVHYYRNGNLIDKTTIDEQLWRYDEEQGRWFIDSPLPKFP